MADEYYADYDLAGDYDELGEGLIPRLIPEGKYILTVKEAKYRTNKNDKPQIIITLEVTEGPYAGQEITNFLTWTDNITNRRITATALAIMGATPEWIRENRATFMAAAEHIVGAVVEASVEESDYYKGTNAIKSFVRTIGLNSATAVAAEAVDLGAPRVPLAKTPAAPPAPQAQQAQQAQAPAAPPAPEAPPAAVPLGAAPVPANAPAAVPAASGWPAV